MSVQALIMVDEPFFNEPGYQVSTRLRDKWKGCGVVTTIKKENSKRGWETRIVIGDMKIRKVRSSRVSSLTLISIAFFFLNLFVL